MTTTTTTEWSAALAALADQIDELEQRLDTDSWDEPAELVTLDLAGPVPAPLVPVARHLAERLAGVERRMTAELDAARDDLRDLALRRRAAQNYQRS